jgi:NAD(P) transhydrogenase subunit alpha
MKVAIPKERRQHELRAAASPDTVKRMVGMGLDVVLETGAGTGAAFPDDLYKAAETFFG